MFRNSPNRDFRPKTSSAREAIEDNRSTLAKAIEDNRATLAKGIEDNRCTLGQISWKFG